MGEFIVRGGDALGFVNHITTNDASRLAIGQAQYSVLCNEQGGALDDCIVYRFDDHYMIVVNASNRDKDREWIARYAGSYGVQLNDRSDDIALLALQGPRAQDILSGICSMALDGIGYYHFVKGTIAGFPAIVSRTGYTGEDGFELYIDAQDAEAVWDAVLDAGAPHALGPIGLGARDSLRLEMGYILYGNDLDENHSPLEAGLGWVTKLDKPDFVGKAALVAQKASGVGRKLIGFRLKERGFPRHGYEVRARGQRTGEVTSGTVSPLLEQGIGLAYVATEDARVGTDLEVMVRDKRSAAEVVKPPFYTGGSIRR
jgi:aminomethyltransferase